MTEVKHGAAGYRRGCRCDVCREGQRLKMRAHPGSDRFAPPVAPSLPLRPRGEGEQEPAVGVMEGKIAREIEDLASGRPWTSACERLEEQALTAARIIDTVMADGRLHLSTPQHRVIRDALADLREILHPVVARIVDPVEAEIEQFLAGLTKLPPAGSFPSRQDEG